MQIAKKQLLGFGGLALVVGMTAFATTLPTGAVSTASGDVEIVVQVIGVNFSTNINSPLDGTIYSSPEIEFSEFHEHAYKMDYTLQLLNADGTVAKEWPLTEHDFEGEDVSGITKFKLNLDNYGGTGVYVFRSVITSSAATTKEDAVQFTYAAIDAKQEDVKAEDEKVSFKVSYSTGIKSITYQLRDASGNFIGEKYVANTPTPTTGGSLSLSIDFGKLSLGSGTYTIYIEGYDELDADGKLIDTASVKFDYIAPKVPDTGSIMSALNISRADYVITGLIGFVAISIVALIAIRRSKRN